MCLMFRSLLICLSLVVSLVTFADSISPQRLMLLRGAIALAEQRDNAVTDLQQAARFFPEDWQSQWLYGEALAVDGQHALAKGQLRRAALLAPWRPEPWSALERLGKTMADPALEYAGLYGLLRLNPDDPAVQRRLQLLNARTGTRVDHPSTATWQDTLPALTLSAGYAFQDRLATLDELRRLHQDKPNDQPLLAALAAAEWHDGNIDSAYAIFQHQHRLAPDDVEATANCVHLALQLGRSDDALQMMRTSPRTREDVQRCYAIWSVAHGRYADALPDLQRLIETHPQDILLHRHYGLALLLSGSAAEAVPSLEIVWREKGDESSVLAYAAALHLAGRNADAVAVITRHLTSTPDRGLLQLQLAGMYTHADRKQEAAEVTERVADLRPETVELTILAAERYMAAGKFSRAKLLAKRLRDQYTADVVALHGTVSLLRLMFMPTEATLVLTRYFGPNMPTPASRPELLMEVARNAMESNRLTEATTALEEILRTTPRYRQAYVQLGKLYQQQRDWTAAITVYQEARSWWPDDLAFSLPLARSARAAGNYSLAIDTYREAARRTNVPEPWLELGDLYQEQGLMGEAQQCWQRAEHYPRGYLRARLRLFEIETTVSADEAQVLLHRVDEERAERAASWKALFAARGISASTAEIDILLLLSPDLPDPALLRDRLQRLEARSDAK